MTGTVTLEGYQIQLVNDSLTAGALKFGSFTLKSGRCDPSYARSATPFNVKRYQGLALLF
jgi:orotate phosphoribosyltransferase